MSTENQDTASVPTTQHTIYDLQSISLPRVNGTMLRAFVSSLEYSATNWALIPKLKADAGFGQLADAVVSEHITPLPLHPSKAENDESQSAHFDFDSIDLDTLPESPLPTAFHYAKLYRSGATTPADVAENVILSIQESEQQIPPLRAVIKFDVEDIRKQALQSTERLKANTPLSILDGVPVCVKDEVDMLPYKTSGGTSFIHIDPAEDSTVVARLRSMGAILIGKTNMHEIGIGVTGNNPHYGCCRNPYNASHFTGGSSSGTGSAVGAGLCPIGIGADGGGSIRIPAAFCGIVGLKPTFGRVSEFGAFPLCWSVAHVGPMTNSTLDCAVTYMAIAGPDSKDPNTVGQPKPHLRSLTDTNLKSLRIGVFTPYFQHASEDIVEACTKMLDHFKSLGAEVVEVTIPNLNLFRIAHVVTILSEMVTVMEEHRKTNLSSFALDTRINIAIGRTFQAMDYVKSQRIRTQAIQIMNSLFERVDVIATPSTAVTAPRIDPAAIPDGESDNTTATEIMRFAFLANLTGKFFFFQAYFPSCDNLACSWLC
eukprot:TRINITY_DN713_c0_g2_i8.p1 TRINITY_DN713_c0_g2~~TRINITY_DN713_c0_g2_i8.p1  ORF type:complete len:541 (+),score=101.65 TRINITY_DN713_c0_g2_i8:64-1686(+)